MPDYLLNRWATLRSGGKHPDNQLNGLRINVRKLFIDQGVHKVIWISPFLHERALVCLILDADAGYLGTIRPLSAGEGLSAKE
jgi:hypothetical protein